MCDKEWPQSYGGTAVVMTTHGYHWKWRSFTHYQRYPSEQSDTIDFILITYMITYWVTYMMQYDRDNTWCYIIVTLHDAIWSWHYMMLYNRDVTWWYDRDVSWGYDIDVKWCFDRDVTWYYYDRDVTWCHDCDVSWCFDRDVTWYYNRDVTWCYDRDVTWYYDRDITWCHVMTFHQDNHVVLRRYRDTLYILAVPSWSPKKHD